MPAYNANKAALFNKLLQSGVSEVEALVQAGITTADLGNYAIGTNGQLAALVLGSGNVVGTIAQAVGTGIAGLASVILSQNPFKPLFPSGVGTIVVPPEEPILPSDVGVANTATPVAATPEQDFGQAQGSTAQTPDEFGQDAQADEDEALARADEENRDLLEASDNQNDDVDETEDEALVS